MYCLCSQKKNRKSEHLLARQAISFSSLQIRMEDVPPDIVDVLQADFNSLR